MRDLFEYIKKYLKADFNIKTYLIICSFTVIVVICREIFNLGYDLLEVLPKKADKALFLFLIYSFSYLFCTVIQGYFVKDLTFLRKKEFYIKLIIVFISLSVLQSYNILSTLFSHIPALKSSRLVMANIGQLNFLFFIIIILYLLYKTFDRHLDKFYGFSFNNANPKMYFWMIIFVVPITFIAGFLPNFTDYYPLFKRYGLHLNREAPQWLSLIFFEVTYICRFVGVELLFRGFFILSFARLLNGRVVLPIAVIYCFLHFGKPMGEIVSSFLGGYLLGVVTLYSRSIVYGILVHILLALSMEFMAYFHTQFL